MDESEKNTQSEAARGGEVLVLGATGKTGRRVVRRLAEAGVPVRAASRRSATAFDWEDRGTWGPAVAGASAVYLVAPEDPEPVKPFTAEAVAAGVRRFVVLSGRGLERVGSDFEFGAGMAAAEAAVRESGAEWTILRPNNFFQNFTEDLWLEPVRAGRLALPIGDVPEPFIDAEDIAEVAAAALTEDGHAGRVYDLSGPEDLTFADAARIIGGAAGRQVRFAELAPDEYRAELRGLGFPEPAITLLDSMFAIHRAGITTGLADGVRQALGRPAADFTTWARRTAATGVWAEQG